MNANTESYKTVLEVREMLYEWLINEKGINENEVERYSPPDQEAMKTEFLTYLKNKEADDYIISFVEETY